MLLWINWWGIQQSSEGVLQWTSSRHHIYVSGNSIDSSRPNIPMLPQEICKFLHNHVAYSTRVLTRSISYKLKEPSWDSMLEPREGGFLFLHDIAEALILLHRNKQKFVNCNCYCKILYTYVPPSNWKHCNTCSYITSDPMPQWQQNRKHQPYINFTHNIAWSIAILYHCYCT